MSEQRKHYYGEYISLSELEQSWGKTLVDELFQKIVKSQDRIVKERYRFRYYPPTRTGPVGHISGDIPVADIEALAQIQQTPIDSSCEETDAFRQLYVMKTRNELAEFVHLCCAIKPELRDQKLEELKRVIWVPYNLVSAVAEKKKLTMPSYWESNSTIRLKEQKEQQQDAAKYYLKLFCKAQHELPVAKDILEALKSELGIELSEKELREIWKEPRQLYRDPARHTAPPGKRGSELQREQKRLFIEFIRETRDGDPVKPS